MPPKATSTEPAQIRRLTRATYKVHVVGTAPLIVNRWSEKSRQMMLDKQQTSARAKKSPKSPEELSAQCQRCRRPAVPGSVQPVGSDVRGAHHRRPVRRRIYPRPG